jgi:hypothetical protein
LITHGEKRERELESPNQTPFAVFFMREEEK